MAQLSESAGERGSYDVVIVGGGPGGLAAALALGRARKRVLLCDAGPRRNAAATQIHNFVTRDGTPPDEFRGIGHQQLAAYPNVQVRSVHVEGIAGTKGAFQVKAGAETVEALRVLLCTGLIDEVPALEGLRDLWGGSVFQCPYCHGWEVRDRRWGYLVSGADLSHVIPFALLLRGWAREVTLFANGMFEPLDEARDQLRAAKVRFEKAPVVRLVGRAPKLEAVELAGGVSVPCDTLFTHPPQRQVDLVRALGVALEEGFVRVDPLSRETSIPGIYAAGDLSTRMQGAILAAAAGVQAAAAMNMELTRELALSGAL